MSPHSRSDHDAVTMGSLIIILIIITIYCNETQCDTSPIIVAKSEDTNLVEKNNIHTIEKEIFWKNLDLSKRKSMHIEESKDQRKNNETNKRKSRFLGSLAFLAGLSFGELATAASSTAKTIAKLPQTSFSLNLGSSKGSPYLAAYYNPYPLLSYPFFFPGPIGFASMINLAKPQTTSHNDLTPQVINLFENKQPINLAENNEEYLDEEKFKNNKRTDNGEGEADDRTELRVQVDRNAEEKIHGCKDNGERKHSNVLKGSIRDHGNLQVDANDLRAILNIQTANMTFANRNQILAKDSTMTTSSSRFIFGSSTNKTQNDNNSSSSTEHPPYIGYYGGYPQNVNHVDLTTGLNAHHDHNQINYNLPYEQPANFYHNDKYNVYSHFNPPFSGPFPSDQVNEYAGTDINRLYHSEYQPPYNNGFRPVT